MSLDVSPADKMIQVLHCFQHMNSGLGIIVCCILLAFSISCQVIHFVIVCVIVIQ